MSNPIGWRSGRLVVIKEAEREARSKRRQVLCKCDCGNQKVIRWSRVKGRITKSCGCIPRENLIAYNFVHGEAGKPLYRVHRNMMLRCYDEKEKQYKEVMSRYNENEQYQMTELFGKLIIELDKYSHGGELRDVLGELFHALNLHNKWKGQYFTPHHVANMMAEMIISNCDEIIKEKGYITANEPACGSGVMVLGIANALENRGYDYQKHIVVTATDIDLKCVHMAYIQLSLYGIPAVVIHGNTLTNEEWSRWYTPMYAWNSASGRIKDVAV